MSIDIVHFHYASACAYYATIERRPHISVGCVGVLKGCVCSWHRLNKNMDVDNLYACACVRYVLEYARQVAKTVKYANVIHRHIMKNLFAVLWSGKNVRHFLCYVTQVDRIYLRKKIH